MTVALVLGKAALAAGITYGGYEAYKLIVPHFQSLRHPHKDGSPVQVLVPSGRKMTPGTSSTPVPPNNGTLLNHAPPPPVAEGKLGAEPSVRTPTGIANLSVNSVSDVQNSLNTLGFANPPITANGTVGRDTVAAIQTFQAQLGIPVDGKISSTLVQELHQSLSKIAAPLAHIGQSLSVQSAPAVVKAAQSPVPEIAAAALNSPVGKQLVSTGLSAIASAFSGADSTDSDVGEDTPSASKAPPSKDAVIALQRALNAVGASPKLDENGDLNDKTIAAIRGFQITAGLGSDGVPAPKTATALAIAIDPNAQAALVPSLQNAADHVTSVAADVATTAPAAAPALAKAAADLVSTAQSTPQPTDAQTHASTASAQAATAASAAPPAVAVPLADASHALAAAASTPAPDPAHLQAASAHISTAAAQSASAGSSATADLTAAANHVAIAASIPDPDKAGDHLNAAAVHLAKAAAGGAPAPTAAISASPTGSPDSPAATPGTPASVNGGDFGWDHGWWFGREGIFSNWRKRLHPAYRPFAHFGGEGLGHATGEFGWGGGFRGGRGFRGGFGERRHHHHPPFVPPMGDPNMPPPPPPPDDDGADAGFGGPPPPHASTNHFANNAAARAVGYHPSVNPAFRPAFNRSEMNAGFHPGFRPGYNPGIAPPLGGGYLPPPPPPGFGFRRRHPRWDRREAAVQQWGYGQPGFPIPGAPPNPYYDPNADAAAQGQQDPNDVQANSPSNQDDGSDDQSGTDDGSDGN